MMVPPFLSFNDAGDPTNREARALPRHQRRAMKRAAAEAERITSADRRFFERFPHRTYRYRRAGRAELAQMAATAGIRPDPGDGRTLFVLVKNLAPGQRLRAFVAGDAADAGDDRPEAELADLWGRLVRHNPAVAEREDALRAAMGLPSGEAA